MIVGIGSDLIEIRRILRLIDLYGERFLNRHFTQEEQEYCERFRDRERRYAGRFAAKEAISKAIGTGIQGEVHWLSFSILPDSLGRPEVSLHGSLKEEFQGVKFHLTISHSEELATAFCIIER